MHTGCIKRKESKKMLDMLRVSGYTTGVVASKLSEGPNVGDTGSATGRV